MNISKEKIKLIVSDLDGTLLNEKKEIGEYTKKILSELINNHDIEFILSSGRSFDGVKRYNDILGNNNYSIVMNGSNIVDNNGCILYSKRLDSDILREEVRSLFQIFERFIVMPKFGATADKVEIHARLLRERFIHQQLLQQ